MKKRCRCGCSSHKYLKLVFFAIGLLAASFLPPKFLVIVLAATIIVLGIIGR